MERILEIVRVFEANIGPRDRVLCKIAVGCLRDDAPFNNRCWAIDGHVRWAPRPPCYGSSMVSVIVPSKDPFAQSSLGH